MSMDFNLSEFNNIGTIYYRPQRSCDQGYVFTRVCDSVHRAGVCPIACWDIYPPGPRQTPPRPRYTPHVTKTPPPRDQRHTPPGIRLMSGRYASYWNPFLFYFMFVKCRHVSLISLHIRNDALHIPVARNFCSKTRESPPTPFPRKWIFGQVLFL